MKKQFLITLTALFAVFMIASFSFADSDSGLRKVGDVMNYNVDTSSSQWMLIGDDYVWNETIAVRDATFIKVHFANFDLPEGAVMELFDTAGSLVISYTGKGPRNMENFWAMSVLGSEAYLECRSKNSPKGLSFQIDKFVPGQQPIFNKSICGSDDLENINCTGRSSAVMANKRAVAHIVFVHNGGSYVCTGSLISQNNHFITNNHCIADQTTCNTMDVYFEYETGSSAGCTSNSASKGTAFSCDTFLTTSHDYDFGLMTLAGNPAGSRGHLNIDPKNLTVGENLYIIQHPNGYPKKIAFGTVYDDVTAGNVSGSDCEYQIDTMGGSSGSPVFDSSNNMVALHHFGGCSSSAGNQGVLMSKVYPLIESYLNGGGSTGNTLKVTVHITHTYIGDLSVILSTPSSQTVTLHAQGDGGSADNINQTFNVTGWDGAYQGTWKLNVADHVGQDTGTLDSWSVEATPDGGSTHTGSASDTPISIPDADSNGINSYIYM